VGNAREKPVSHGRESRQLPSREGSTRRWCYLCPAIAGTLRLRLSLETAKADWCHDDELTLLDATYIDNKSRNALGPL
jgi:hypothetical protein